MSGLAGLLHAQATFNIVPSRIIGQPTLQQQGLTSVAPNLVEGREFFNPTALAVDTSTSPSILYVADTNNNRVLAWKNASAFTKGDKADLVIGQRDFFATSPQGPASGDLSTGLFLPIALAVDSSGNLYVADGGNNRILRYPKPLSQRSALLAVDLIIGQHDGTGRSANEGLTTPNAKTLFFSTGSSFNRAGLALDASGNLWVSDPGNNRVLRFRASDLTANNNEPSADLVLGQFDFSGNRLPANLVFPAKNALNAPSAIAFDPQGRLYVADDFNRVLVYLPPISSGALAARVMGVVPATQQQPNPPLISESTLGTISNGAGYPPEAIFFVGNNPYIADSGNARILKYAPFDQWPAECLPVQPNLSCATGTAFSPPAIAVIGQMDFFSNRSDAGQPSPSASTFSGPVSRHNANEANGVSAAVFAGKDLFVADAGNNRVLVFPQGPDGNFSAANRVLGQVDFQYSAVNLVEGREFYFQSSGGAAVIDQKSTPPHLYVSDPQNNRVLGFNDYRTVKPGDKADLVLGQPDLYTTMVNYPKNDSAQLNDQGLSFPEGIALDAGGNLWVADLGNGRVVRFPSPFNQPAGTPARVNLTIGQPDPFTRIPDASSATMSAPYGIAFTSDGSLAVSDTSFNRVLYFKKPAGGDFSNGQSATTVLGQRDFITRVSGTLSSPSLIAVDPDDRLYVADTGHNQILVWGNLPALTNGQANLFALTAANTGVKLANPSGVFADLNTANIWVANTGGANILRFPRFDALVSNTTPDITIPSSGPLAVTTDPFGNPVVVESINRVSFFYQSIDLTGNAGGVPGRFSGNAANYFQRFAPGLLATIFAYPNSHVGTTTASATTVPWPTTLGDVTVTVAGIPAPVFYVSPGQINFQVPGAVPVGTDPQEVRVTKTSTGQILATSSQVLISAVAPGLFTSNSTGVGQLAAVNQDGSVNSGTNPAKAGSYITLYGTGVGVVPGGPPDGTPASGITNTADRPAVFINATPIADADIQYSGLAPGFIGLWQINVKIPASAAGPTGSGTGDVSVVVLYPAFNGSNANLDQFGVRRVTTIRVTP